MATAPELTTRSSFRAALPGGGADDTPRVVVLGPAGAGTSTLFEMLLRALDPRVTPGELPSRLAGARFGLVTAAGQDYWLYDAPGDNAELVLADPERASVELRANLRQADAVVVALDATSGDAELARRFGTLDGFLSRLEGDRTERREAGGLPVVLVLTKCDRLARDADRPADWLARVGAEQERVAARFAKYFAPAAPAEVVQDFSGLGEGGAPPEEPSAEPPDPDDEESLTEPGDEPSGYWGFGEVAVALAAVAQSVPRLPGFDADADAGGAFGLRALAKTLFPAALAHRRTVRATRKRLRATAAGAVGLVLAALIGILGLAATDTDAATARLLERVKLYQDTEPGLAARLSDAQRGRHRRELVTIAEDAHYAALPEPARRYVEGRLGEIAEYGDYRRRFDPPRLGPPESRTRAEFAQLARELEGDLAPPPDRARDWAGTEAVRLWEKWRADLALLLRVESEYNDFYRDAVRRLNQLALVDRPPDSTWRAEVAGAVLAARPPHRLDEPVPGSPQVPGLVRGRPLRYAAAVQVERVAAAVRDARAAERRLLGVADVADALGLTGGASPAGPPVLDLPEPKAGAAGSLLLATGVLAQLAVAYPPAPEFFRDYRAEKRGGYPAPIENAVRSRLGSIVATAERHWQQILRGRVGDPESAERWRQLAGELDPATNAAAADWDRLFAVYAALLDPAATPAVGPVAEWAAFVRRSEFPARLDALELSLPDDLDERRARPRGDLILTVRGNGQSRDIAFRPEGEPLRELRSARYTLRPVAGAAIMALKPGDVLVAELALVAGEKPLRLRWGRNLSAVYGFDAILRAPEKTTDAGQTLTPAVPEAILVVRGDWPRLPRVWPDVTRIRP